ncbi:hypothetical protein CPB84DRAFT_1915932 [Gymnopilus junonius]|uniref:SPX domain-containing protein n=1 Tax=Gymnopilus junonius TaxID=109634 RepID=A0A9P5TMH9_GYMJU|nr:hypothetical protein CPB84DRAFT_1915932 [Gymnopilus junonius]
MHFSKTYSQLLLDLPPELRDNAIQYRQVRLCMFILKKVINRIVNELSSLGLKPALLHELIEASDSTRGPAASSLPSTSEQEMTVRADASSSDGEISSAAPYITGDPQPSTRLKLSQPRVDAQSPDAYRDVFEGDEDADQENEGTISGHTTLLWRVQQLRLGAEGLGAGSIVEVDDEVKNSIAEDIHLELDTSSSDNMHEIIIPLVSDTEFYSMLMGTLKTISVNLSKMHAEFCKTLESLSRTIADSSHPASVAASFHPHSRLDADAGAVRVRTGQLKSDLYFWREIFQLYLEAEVFENVGEAKRGETSVEESERRLQLFVDRVTQHGIMGDHHKFRRMQSADALQDFLNLNLFILNVKKFSHANSEATRKILKKHAKRTALFYPGLQPGVSSPSPTDQAVLALVPSSSSGSTPFSLARILAQAIGETLLPIIPSIEDYSCLICTSLAFKPIRLSCGHLFCVRCLVKMQKRNQGDCPMCRARVVLSADRSNVDWALLNFMQDWFPIEAKEKLKANEKEATEEELKELGIDPDAPCRVM